VPDSAFIRSVCRRHGGAIALTSANISGAASPTSAQDFRELWHRCAAVFDGGPLGADRSGSTIVDLSAAGRFRIVRTGSAPELVRSVLAQKYSLKEDDGPR
jgi:2',5'-phosphodiesterase